MRCLYCGNELALLKKLRGGGEFCSEAHRQKYQEEYTQLALNRLMQAHPKAQKRAPAPAADERVSRPPEPPPPPPAAPPEPPKPAVAAPEPCGFLIQRFEPHLYETHPFSHGPMPLHALSAAVSPSPERTEPPRELPRAEAFRTLAFTLRQSAPPQLTAPEFLDFHFPPEFQQASDSWLRVFTADDVSASATETPSEPEPPAPVAEVSEPESVATVEAPLTPEPAAAPSPAAGRRHIDVVETPAQPAPPMSSPAAAKPESVATVETPPKPEPAMPAPAAHGHNSVAVVEEPPEPEPEIAEEAGDNVKPGQRPVELRKVILRLAPPPNSGAQDIGRPTPFTLSGPDLPAVKPNVLRLRFGFAPPPARPAGAQSTITGASRSAERPAETSLATHTFLTFEGPLSGPAKPEGRSKLPLILSIAGAVVLIAAAAIFMFNHGTTGTGPMVRKAEATPHPIEETDWTTDWSSKPPRGEQFSILRPSLIMSDYRIQFQGQIDAKSLGWIFRATDPKNYYSLKLEITKPGAMAEVSLIRAVVDGGQQKNRSRIPLKAFARDTVFKIRTDVAGSTFQTWIQGDLVDTWHDDRFKAGGFGLLTDAAGRARLQMIQLSDLQYPSQKR
jgi:hypothetical protein